MAKKGNTGLIVAGAAGAGLILLGMTRKSGGGYRGKATFDVDVTGKSPKEKRKRTRKVEEILAETEGVAMVTAVTVGRGASASSSRRRIARPAVGTTRSRR